MLSKWNSRAPLKYILLCSPLQSPPLHVLKVMQTNPPLQDAGLFMEQQATMPGPKHFIVGRQPKSQCKSTRLQRIQLKINHSAEQINTRKYYMGRQTV